MSDDNHRRLVLLRHGHAEWADVPDRDRLLTDRGRAAATGVGRWLQSTGVAPDLVLCSPAVRTRETWKLVAAQLARRPRTVYEDRVYEASPGELIALLNELPDDATAVAVIGHNPGLHGLAQVLAGDAADDLAARLQREGFPAAAAAVLTFDGGWPDLEPGVGTLVSLRQSES
ncbi:SixA phosphatase family protein [Actinokineospora bangkokensis]|uniref:SixA phosphatase family protein n=1 Tax=Actinokineospora bangkokensis TaxID=1193682 RepID=UPI000AAAF752|nr:histidine phosphatase family protein [Actinokineospora bangkokensis]